MIKIEYHSGVVTNLDRLPDETTKQHLIVSFMTVEQMVKFFNGSEAKAYAKSLGLLTSGTETQICRRIQDHYSKKT